MTTPDHVDVLIIGAGLSGIGAAAHLAKDLPATWTDAEKSSAQAQMMAEWSDITAKLASADDESNMARNLGLAAGGVLLLLGGVAGGFVSGRKASVG